MVNIKYTESFAKQIQNNLNIQSPLFVLLGDLEVIDFSKLGCNILDKSSFFSLGGETIFTRSWFSQVFIKINASTEPLILSYAQYSYLTKYLESQFFAERTIFLIDNLRQIFPLNTEDFIADTQEEDTTEKELPVYQADQFNLDSHYFYSPKLPDAAQGHIISVFNTEVELEISNTLSSGFLSIDPYSDWQTIDIYLSEVVRNSTSIKTLFIKYYPKQAVSIEHERILRLLNSFLHELGGNLKFVSEETHTASFVPSSELLSLLHNYWGPRASFRDIQVYKNPNDSNEIIDVSQGEVVQTLIDEYENVRNGNDWRDVFLTAPTGAGKSLLFQLPAFYISQRGDVTIVVSPLIALMKDQVNAIIHQRHYDKVAYINSEVSFIDRDRIINKCKIGEIDVLYMAPELLMSYDIRYFVGERHIGLMVIDEAHLITTWGRDFRVDYWYIGNHINKIRKYTEQKFPMIAVTATAVYGGDKNDMVFDTVDSLSMHFPHYYIGIVKRNNIEFIISNYTADSKGFDNKKLKQTSDCVRKINELGFKTLVYAPYTMQVKKIAALLNENQEIAVRYFGGTLDALSKDQAEQSFRMNQKRVMVCTKAFGMGVDIPDIQVVYHHAPSGLLPDYVQEIGRAARQKGIRGYAVVNYSTHDQKYSKQLYGMSSLKLYQIKAVLKKVYDTYCNNNNRRNMLVSVSDFAFAFSNTDDMETKVKTALMMIEKDYLAKYRYNVLLARPKQLFTKVFSLVSDVDYINLNTQYPECVEFITERQDKSKIIIIDLNRIWSNYMSDMSFPVLKRKYYNGSLFLNKNITLVPKLKISFFVTNVPRMKESVNNTLNALRCFFIQEGVQFFMKEDLLKFLRNKYDDGIARQLATFILSTYSSKQAFHVGTVEEDAFLQERQIGGKTQYRVFGNRYEGGFASLMTLLSHLFDSDNTYACRYISKENSLPYIRIGNLMEILSLGSFEMLGGEAPMIFIRINNPEKIHYDSQSPSYKNILLEKTQKKHIVSLEVMDWFFTHKFSNDERWNFIEDFFLGENNEELFRKYPGSGCIATFDVTKELLQCQDNLCEQEKQIFVTSQSLEYPPKSGKYMPKDYLTIEIEGQNITHSIAEWIEKDPLSLYPLVRDKIIYVDPQYVYSRLMKKISENYKEEYTKILGLKKMIEFSGYDKEIEASIVYNTEPVKFYKWWIKNRNEIYMTLQERIRLFDKVNNLNPSALLKQDLKMLNFH